MKISVETNFAEIYRWLDTGSKQVRFAETEAINRVGAIAQAEVQLEMKKVFDRPTKYALNSLKLLKAFSTRPKIEAVLWFKDKSIFDSAESMIVPHIDGGTRQFKPMEIRLQRAGLLPSGWYVVPGQGADIDAYGNMSRGQITLLLNVLGTYREAGYNKANPNTVKRLKNGNAKRGVYGFEFFVNPVGSKATTRSGHPLLPGVYKRVTTGFGSSLKPVLIFVRGVKYKKRLDFYGIVNRAIERDFPAEFDAAYAAAMRTAR